MVADVAEQGTTEVSLVIPKFFFLLLFIFLFSLAFIALFGMIPMWNDLFVLSGVWNDLLALEDMISISFSTDSSLQDWDTCLVTVPFYIITSPCVRQNR